MANDHIREATKKIRLIDAWRLVIDLARLKSHGEYDHEEVMAVIASQETVDAVEVVHGRWVKAECSEKNGNSNCSNCGHFDWNDCNYCPNCGAKMDGDGNG